eukprot:10919878-Prorocentrum_lima.AAC.1
MSGQHCGGSHLAEGKRGLIPLDLALCQRLSNNGVHPLQEGVSQARLAPCRLLGVASPAISQGRILPDT